MRFVLIGQPNCGKSTLFNQVAGYRAETGNFSGTTVTYIESKVRVLGEIVDLVDLPGTYTLMGTNPAEREAWKYLISKEVDVIINVIDATQLYQGLTLTMELLELGKPVVIAMNMMDEAARAGMRIDGLGLQKLLGISVIPVIASKGRGIRDVFVSALEQGKQKSVPKRLKYSAGVEVAIQKSVEALECGGNNASYINTETLAIKILEGDEIFIKSLINIPATTLIAINNIRKSLDLVREQGSEWSVITERYGLAGNISRKVLQRGEKRLIWRDRLDDYLLHPVLGYVFLIAILYFFFQFIYGIGSALEKPLLFVFSNIDQLLVSIFPSENLLFVIISGLIQGISGGIAIVLPYLFPFLFGLGLLEDIGYLPRVAFMMDALMHRVGLHGKAIVPFILGYGCNVPAVMSTRILEDKRDRFLAATLSTMVPCAARLAIIFGLVAFYLGPRLALVIYLFNMIVVAITGRILSRLLPEVTPGLILEMPIYRIPTLKSTFMKAWFRMKEFIFEAWPILIIGSVILALFNFFNISGYLNILIRPITWLLGLPSQVGVPLIFGVLRKELSILMLRQALNVSNFSDALSPEQMITFTIFVVFYIPCLATLVVLNRELGIKRMLQIAGLSVGIAIGTAMFARGVALII